MACIKEYLTDSFEDRYKFWEKIDLRLRLLRIRRAIDENMQRVIEDKIAETVSPPSEEYVRWLAENEPFSWDRRRARETLQRWGQRSAYMSPRH